MTPRRFPPGHRGFTLVEVLMVMILTAVVVSGILRALTAQKRFYARQSRILDARHAMRATATILSSEFRELSSLDGDLYAVGPDSVVLRSTVGFAVVCKVDEAGGQLALSHISGDFRLAGEDSVLVYVENTVRDDDNGWQAREVTGVAAGGLACADPGVSVERVLSVSTVPSGLLEGAPARFFRPYIYALYTSPDGRWWLGRRLRSVGSDYVPVAGPLAPPDTVGFEGLVLTYYDPDGNVTSKADSVARVELEVHAPTFKSLTDPDYREMSTSTYLRNDG